MLGGRINICHLSKRFGEVIHFFSSQLFVHELSALENDDDLDEVLLLKEFHGLLALDLQVMITGADPEADPLHRRLLGILALLLLLLLDLVEVLPIIHDPAHRRLSLRRHFHQVRPSLLSQSDGLLDRKEAKLLIVHANDANG